MQRITVLLKVLVKHHQEMNLTERSLLQNVNAPAISQGYPATASIELSVLLLLAQSALD